jgi:hypothetical protein
MDEKLTKFLGLVPGANWHQPPQVWGEQLRQALSAGLVTVGFGGVLKLTDAGREAAKLRYRLDGTQAWQS